MKFGLHAIEERYSAILSQFIVAKKVNLPVSIRNEKRGGGVVAPTHTAIIPQCHDYQLTSQMTVTISVISYKPHKTTLYYISLLSYSCNLRILFHFMSGWGYKIFHEKLCIAEFPDKITITLSAFLHFCVCLHRWNFIIILKYVKIHSYFILSMKMTL